MRLYAEPVTRRYFSPGAFSAASLVCLVSWLACLGLPLLLAYWSQGFWLKVGAWQEQPLVKLQRRDTIVQVLGASGESLAQWSAQPAYAKWQQQPVASSPVPVVKVAEVDLDLDGRPDVLSVRVRIPVAAGQQVSAVRLALFFTYQLSDFLPLSMYAMAVLDVSTPVATASGCAVNGDLRFKQRQLLPASQPRLVYNYPVVNWTAALMDPELVRWPTIVRSYTLRDERTYVDLDDPVWTYGRADSQPFEMDAVIRYAPDVFHYIPSGAELFKWAWIQYFSYFVVFYVVLSTVLGVLFKNQLVHARVAVDAPVSAGGGAYVPVKF